MNLFFVWMPLFLFNVWLPGQCCGKDAEKDSSPKVVIVVLSQSDDYHVSQAEAFKERFLSQIADINENERPRLLMTHEDLVSTHGAWTVFNLVEPLWDIYQEDSFEWLFICEEDTRINVKLLLKLLSTFDYDENLFLGRVLRDDSTTIIHHFAFANNPSQFAYPDFGVGFAFSINLFKRLQSQIKTGKLKTDFSIDAKHELALFIWENGKGTSMTDIPSFCFADESSRPDCITSQPIKFPKCGPPVEKDKLFVAVKTCEKFHSTRVPVVKATWAKQATEIEFYSEVEDKSIPTVNIRIPNTEKGHCGKTMAIIHRVLANQHHSHPWWILIADDDTIINLDRLRSLLACYNNHRHPVALGERYGYALVRGHGYDYITGGGGMVFNLPALTLLSENCRCYSDDAPDDMTLGMCLKSIGIPVTHSRYFHQARPEDYSKAFLSNQHPVSFHKHWQTDPYKVFERISKPVDIHHDNNNSDKLHSTGSQKKEEL